jgi:Tol biopolymer transport system component
MSGSAANAAHPGKNGVIAYSSGIGGFDKFLELRTVNPDKTGDGRMLSAESGGRRLLLTQPDWSPDGNSLAYIRSTGSSGELYVFGLAGGDPQPAEPSVRGVRAPTWAADGKRIAYLRYSASNAADASIRILDLDRGTSREVRGNCGAIGDDLAWGRSGRLAFEVALGCAGDPRQQSRSGWGLVTMNEGGGGVRVLQATRTGGQFNKIRSLDWSPDGSRLLVVSEDGVVRAKCGAAQYDSIWIPANLYILDGQTGTVLKNLTVGGSVKDWQPQSASWSPDGTLAVMAMDKRPCTGDKQGFVRPRVFTMSVSAGVRRQITDVRTGKGVNPSTDETYELDVSDFGPSWQPCIAGKTVRCVSSSSTASGSLWDPPTRPRSECRGQMHVVFAVYTGIAAPVTNGCWSWNRVAPNADGGGNRPGPWRWCGNRWAEPKQRVQPGYWVFDDIALGGAAPALLGSHTRDVNRCAELENKTKPETSTGWVFTAYRNFVISNGRYVPRGQPGSPVLMAPTDLAGLRDLAGADRFFFQLYDGADWGCSKAPNPNCALLTLRGGSRVAIPHPILTEPLYDAWNKARNPAGRHRLIGQLDVTSGVPAAKVKEAVLRLCRASLADGFISLNVGTRGGLSGNFGREQLKPIEEALRLCVPLR